MLKRFMILVLSFVMLLSSVPAFAETNDDLIKKVEKYGFDYTYEKYLNILPFEMVEKDKEAARGLFNEIGYAFFRNDLEKARELLDEFYGIISKYWMNSKTLNVLLPLDEMLKEGGQLITPEDEKSLRDAYKKLAEIRNKKDFEAYFKQIQEIYNDFYDVLAKSIGDVNNELQLVQYIKGADKLTIKDLSNYNFNDYLEILPFDLNDSDYAKGKKIFKDIIDHLKANEDKEAKIDVEKLNDILAPYWIKDKTFKALLPHESYQYKAINHFSRKGQMAMFDAYKKAQDAFKAVKESKEISDELYDEYFEAINDYYKVFGQQIREYYGDFFEEVVFIRS
ncbi:hypothetical protein EZV73_05860 [Acidaminobacter sp. JC074]|uniref:hypothetical protein n=1 Tax=Acidaminobacter sp. JC074 TaxID=2530199 RepID=UPI001F0DB811|nr:hypothetical protein [Acidaminobacter sp. JC074]MCH4887084.1 hypothetical protein [Acidaminobacter sp. JC074]